MYDTYSIKFSLWHIVGDVWGYNELKRLPRKQKKALKKSILRDIYKVDKDYKQENPHTKKLPKFSYKQD